jgi:hypothetical protein
VSLARSIALLRISALSIFPFPLLRTATALPAPGC